MKKKLVSNNISEEQFQLVSDYLNKKYSCINGFFLWSVKKESGKETVFYSDNIKDVTGYTGNEIKHFPGRGNSLICEDDAHRIKKVISDFISDASQNNIELTYRIVKKDKKVIWINESISVLRNNNGDVIEFHGIVNDISKHKQEELNLSKDLENLKVLNSSKDRFISMLSHDLRAPFTSILGFSEILINEPNLTNDERLEYLTYINDSSQHQLQLINYLLDWSRLQTGRIKIEPQRLNAQTIVFNCVSSLTGNAIRKNIEINVSIKDNLFIQADERLITQVVTNLISNAIKFSDEGKTIEVSADNFNDAMVEFIVKDEGTGISEDNKGKLFKIEKMFSVEGTKGEKGTGLGLSLVKEIIDKHEGEIWFYSEFGEGSEFHFTVPCSHNTILLVENNSEMKTRYENLLNEEFSNFKVIPVKNGYEALTKISDRLPSLVITDYDMPLMNGLQLIEFIRKEDKHFKIPIIAMVTELTEDLMNEYQTLGIDVILQKPIDDELLTDKVQVILNY